MPGHQAKAHFFKEGLEHVALEGCEFDELETTKAHWILKQFRHSGLQMSINPRVVTR
jgi:hypothetical protein